MNNKLVKQNQDGDYVVPQNMFNALVNNVLNNMMDEVEFTGGTEAYKRAKQSPKVKKVMETLNDVYASTRNIQSDTMKTAAAIIEGLDPNNAAINVRANNTEITDNRNVITLNGKTAKNNDLQDVIRENVEKRNRDLMMNAPGGVYRHIVLCRRNKFINRRFPLMKKSNSLFVDDMNNGSYRGGDSRFNPFKIFKNGIPITDAYEVSKISEILNPQSQTNISVDTIPFKSLQHESDVLFRQNGSCYIRTIPLRDVCKRLYIKYILAQKKKKDVETIKAKIAVESQYIIKDVEAFHQAGLESDDLKPWQILTKPEVEPYLENLNPSSYTLKDTYYLETEDGNKTPISKHDAHELQIGLETFEQFARRALYGDHHEIVNIPSNASPIGLHASINIAGIPQRYAVDLLNDMFNKAPNDRVNIGLESVEAKCESLGNYLTEEERNVLLNTSFTSIYNTYVDDLPTLSGFNDYVGTEAVMVQTGRSTLEDIYLKCLRMESIGSDITQIGTESISDPSILKDMMNINNELTAGLETELNIVNHTYQAGTEVLNPAISDASTPSIQAASVDSTANKKIDKKRAKRIEAEIAERRALFSKLDKQFANINGEVSYILDDTRGVPLNGGRKFIGYFDTEYTHHDVSYLVTMRTVMGNPINFSSNLDMLDLNKEEYEEIMGRLIYSDTIKPIIEANMSTKFIKDNSENAYTLLKLMEENEISNQMSFQDLTRFSMYNLARVTFVPANEIVVKRNGFEGMGESLYENVTIPAMAWIIINEAMYAYYLVDGKGISFLTVPKGINPNSNVYGQSTVEDVIRSLNVTRSDINDMGAYNFGLTHKIVTLYKDEDSQGDIQLQTIEYPDFKFNETFISTLEQLSTGGVGYNSAMYTSKDGTNVELAKKLFEMNDTEALEIMKYQELKQKADSQLATRLLRLRGGEKYKDYTVIVVPPDVSRGNRNKKTELMNEALETLKSKVAIIEEIYKGDKQVESSMKAIKLNILKSMNVQDLDVNDLKSLIETSIRETATEIASIAKEQVGAVGNPTGIGNDYEEENQNLFGEEEF